MNVFRSFLHRSTTVIVIVLLLLAAITTSPWVRSWNDASRMATVQSLVEHQTFKIDQSVFVDSGDKVFIDGHFYSDKPVAPSVLGAVVYWPLFKLGITLDYGWNLAYYLVTFIVIKGFWLMGLLAFYAALRLTSLDTEKRLWLTASLGVASLYLTWGSTFNNHILAASQLMIGFYYLISAKQGDSVKRYLFYAGFFFSLAAIVDVPVGAYYAAFFGYVLIQADLRKNAFFFVVPCVLTVIPALMVNYYISGSVMPLQINQEYFDYPGSPWIDSEQLSGVSINEGLFFLKYGFSAMFGSRGFLLYNPLLFIALPYLIFEIRKGRRFTQEARVIGVVSLIIVLYYLLFTNNYGGGSYSIRWFVPMLPIVFFFMHPFFENFTPFRRRFFFTVFFISTIIAGVGMLNPWSLVELGNTPFLGNIIELKMLLNN